MLCMAKQTGGKSSGDQTIALRIGADLLVRVDEQAEKEHRKRSEMIRVAIIEYLENHAPRPGGKSK